MGNLVTIGLPFYNNKGHLAKAIGSVLQQSHQDWELLLVNDGSTDGSSEIARSVTDPRIRLIEHRENRGLACRLNEIAAMANGEFLFRMDADDVMHPERVERQHELLRGSPPNTVVGTAAIEMDDAGRLIKIIRRSGMRGGYAARSAFIHPTVAARTAWFRENPYSEALVFRRVQDAELWIRTAPASRFVLMEEPLLFYRRPDQLSFEKYMWQTHALITILAKSPVVGGPTTRLFYCALELCKLQVRLALYLFKTSAGKRWPALADNPQLAEYRKIYDQLGLG